MRRGSGVCQPVDEYHSIENVSMPPDPPGIGVEPGAPTRVECRRRMPTGPLAHHLMELLRSLPRPRLRPGPRHRPGDRVRHVHVDLGGRPRGERPVVQRHPDRRVGTLREVGDDVVPRLLLRAVELGTHLLEGGAELRGEDVELRRRLDLVDPDHVVFGVMRSQKVAPDRLSVPPPEPVAESA